MKVKTNKQYVEDKCYQTGCSIKILTNSTEIENNKKNIP